MAISRRPSRGSCSIRPGNTCCSSGYWLKRPIPRGFRGKAVKEIAYHRELASEWTIRLGDGAEEHHDRRMGRRNTTGTGASSPNCLRSTTLQAAIDRGIGPDPREFEDEYRSAIASGDRASPSWKRRRSSGRSLAAGAAITASISAMCWR